MTNVNDLIASSLVTPTVPLPHAMIHLSEVVRCNQKVLELSTSNNASSPNEVLEGKLLKLLLQTASILGLVVNGFGRQIGNGNIVTSDISIPHIPGTT